MNKCLFYKGTLGKKQFLDVSSFLEPVLLFLRLYEQQEVESGLSFARGWIQIFELPRIEM